MRITRRYFQEGGNDFFSPHFRTLIWDPFSRVYLFEYLGEERARESRRLKRDCELFTNLLI